MAGETSKARLAVYAGDAEALRAALRREDPDQADKAGRTLLMDAAVHRQLAIAAILIDAGSSIDARDRAGFSALHFAAQEQSAGIVAALIDAGATVDVEDAHGNTPLSKAVFFSHGKGDAIRCLLAAGADRDKENKHGISPLKLARTIANYDVARFFEWAPSGDHAERAMTDVRTARPSDAAALAAIARAAYADYVPLIGREPPPMLQDFPADIADGACWVSGDPPEGYVVARPKCEDWLIENVAVAPEAQGRGLGRVLMAFAEEEGRRRGFGKAVLYTHIAMTRNRALYPALGYTETGERQEHGLHRAYFEKPLGSG